MAQPKSLGLILRNSALTFIMVIVLAVVPWHVGRGMAQQSTPLDDVPPTPSPISSEDGGDGLPQRLRNVSPQSAETGPDMAIEAAPAFSYYRLLGTAFNTRTSTTTFAYNFNGCLYETGGTDNRFMAPLLLPDNSEIKFLRLYFDDTSAGTDITAWLTRYQPGFTSEDLTSVTSAGSGGYGTTLSSEISHIVDLTSWAYTIIIAPNANASTNTFCGVRVAYYAPSIWLSALPLISRNTP